MTPSPAAPGSCAASRATRAGRGRAGARWETPTKGSSGPPPPSPAGPNSCAPRACSPRTATASSSKASRRWSQPTQTGARTSMSGNGLRVKKPARQAGAGVYSPSAGGCLSLISSGQSSEDTELIDASDGGKDVFFATSASLLPQDPGLIDIYDARTGGGFPPAPGRPPACEGEACQGPLGASQRPDPRLLCLRRGGQRERRQGEEEEATRRSTRPNTRRRSRRTPSSEQTTSGGQGDEEADVDIPRCGGAGALVIAPSAGAFAFNSLDDTFTNQDGSPATQAGSHPFAQTTTLGFDTIPDPNGGVDIPDGDLKDMTVSPAAGLRRRPDRDPDLLGS